MMTEGRTRFRFAPNRAQLDPFSDSYCGKTILDFRSKV
jgi:hypothetical protein